MIDFNITQFILIMINNGIESAPIFISLHQNYNKNTLNYGFRNQLIITFNLNPN